MSTFDDRRLPAAMFKLVRVEIDVRWHDMAKVGCAPCDYPALEPVDWTAR